MVSTEVINEIASKNKKISMLRLSTMKYKRINNDLDLLNKIVVLTDAVMNNRDVMEIKDAGMVLMLQKSYIHAESIGESALRKETYSKLRNYSKEVETYFAMKGYLKNNPSKKI